MRRKKINAKKPRSKKHRSVLEVITRNEHETRKLGELLAKIVFNKFNKHPISIRNGRALIISLDGDLGSGKTTFAKGFAKGLGIRETIQSPTFVIAKIYQFFRTKPRFFIHIDAYRVTAKDLPAIGWDEFIKDARNIILLEWGERIRAVLPKNHIKVLFQHRAPQKRFIRFLVS